MKVFKLMLRDVLSKSSLVIIGVLISAIVGWLWFLSTLMGGWGPVILSYARPGAIATLIIIGGIAFMIWMETAKARVWAAEQRSDSDVEKDR